MNERQTERLKQLADWLHDNDRKFLFELLVPAEKAQLESVGGDADRYDAELRPELMRRVDRALPGRRRRGRHLEDRGRRHARGRADALRADPQGRGPRERQERAPGPRRVRRQGRPLAARGRAGRGLHRLRDRPLDLVGRAEGLPRRVARRATRRRRPDRRRSTCASSRSTTRPRGLRLAPKARSGSPPAATPGRGGRSPTRSPRPATASATAGATRG